MFFFSETIAPFLPLHKLSSPLYLINQEKDLILQPDNYLKRTYET